MSVLQESGHRPCRPGAGGRRLDHRRARGLRLGRGLRRLWLAAVARLGPPVRGRCGLDRSSHRQRRDRRAADPAPPCGCAQTEAPAAAERPGVLLRIVAGALAATVSRPLSPPSCCSCRIPARRLRPRRAVTWTRLGVGNPITAVLIAYRSFDTMLEKVVLILGCDRRVVARARPLLGRRCRSAARRAARTGALAFLAPVAAAARHRGRRSTSVWVGANEPGGAFQGGAILAAMALIVMMARLAEAPEIRQPLAAAGAGRRTGGVSRRSASQALPYRAASSAIPPAGPSR